MAHYHLSGQSLIAEVDVVIIQPRCHFLGVQINNKFPLINFFIPGGDDLPQMIYHAELKVS